MQLHFSKCLAVAYAGFCKECVRATTTLAMVINVYRPSFVARQHFGDVYICLAYVLLRSSEWRSIPMHKHIDPS